MSKTLKRSRAARTRGPDPAAPLNVADIDTPGWGKPARLRYTKAQLVGEEREAMLSLARECGRAAYTDYEVAEVFGVAPSTIWTWCVSDAAFAQALSLGEDIANDRVERALFHRAMGYSYPSEKIFVHDGVVTRVRTVEHVPPDKTAMIFWLKNRARHRWRDVVDQNIEANVKMPEADPRKLAMAVLALLREGVEQARNEAISTIEHNEVEDADISSD